jgi:hypothetical protein
MGLFHQAEQVRAARAESRAVTVTPMLLEPERLLIKGDLVVEIRHRQ